MWERERERERRMAYKEVRRGMLFLLLTLMSSPRGPRLCVVVTESAARKSRPKNKHVRRLCLNSGFLPAEAEEKGHLKGKWVKGTL